MSGLEHVVFCIDNSAWSRNGDYRPSRLDVQLETIYDYYPRFLDSNPENTMGIITMGGNRVTVRTSLTREKYKISTAVKELEKNGNCDLYRGLAMAQLVLKHRENTNGRPRIIAFVGSPIHEDPKLSNLARLLEKDTISVDIYSFGEREENHKILEEFISKVNFDNNSHLYEVTPSQHLSDVVMPSNMNAGFDDMDDLDPELRRAMEESMRTYQMETGQTANTMAAAAEPNDLDALRNMYGGSDVDDEFLAELNAAMLESLNDNQDNGEKKDEKKDDAKGNPDVD